jgi:hypothetical protein
MSLSNESQIDSATMEVHMSSITKSRKFHWLGATAVAALSLVAVSVPLTPAKAFIGVDVGGVDIGVGGPYWGPGPYYYHPYHHYYGYGPGYYGYGPYGW